jgi:5-methylcytosine-specific restriction protein A
VWTTPQTCAEPNCGKPTLRGLRFCEAHKTVNYTTRPRQRQPWHRWYDEAWYRRSRLSFFANPANVICATPDCNRPATDLDHKIPHKGNRRLFEDVRNWQGLCASCHSEKTAREDGGFGNVGTTSDSEPKRLR